jgi:hypothetical protein
MNIQRRALPRLQILGLPCVEALRPELAVVVPTWGRTRAYQLGERLASTHYFRRVFSTTKS